MKAFSTRIDNNGMRNVEKTTATNAMFSILFMNAIVFYFNSNNRLFFESIFIESIPTQTLLNAIL